MIWPCEHRCGCRGLYRLTRPTQRYFESAERLSALDRGIPDCKPGAVDSFIGGTLICIIVPEIPPSGEVLRARSAPE